MEANTSFIKIVTINSLITGVILFMIGIIYYLLDVNYFNYGFMALNFLVLIAVSTIFGVYGTRSYRDRLLDGKISYWKKFLTIFLISFIGMLLSSLLGLLFYQLIDPDYLVRQAQEFIAKLEEQGLSEEQLLKIEESIMDGTSVTGQLMSSLKSLPIISVILSLIVAATIKGDTTIPKESV